MPVAAIGEILGIRRVLDDHLSQIDVVAAVASFQD
jgi:hypothetical protein